MVGLGHITTQGTARADDRKEGVLIFFIFSPWFRSPVILVQEATHQFTLYNLCQHV